MARDNYKEQAVGELSVSTMKKLKSRKSLIVYVVLSLFGAVFLIYVISILRKSSTSELFRWYVLDPIPASVTGIKVDQPHKIRGYTYVFRFDINRADLDRIVESRPFREAQITGFLGGGSLFFKWKGSPNPIGNGFSMYGTRKPSWYTLESWDNPETYALVQEVKDVKTSDIQVLIYNGRLGQAFFIVSHYW